MDVIAHALWTNAAYRAAALRQGAQRSKKDAAWAIFFGIAPDLFSFGILFFFNLVRHGMVWPYMQASVGAAAPVAGGMFRALIGSVPPPAPSEIPAYVHQLYNLTHSFVIFAAVFLVVWYFRKSPYWLMAGWGFHILIDVFTHTDRFFPTPALFPLSDFHVSVTSWASPVFMAVNYAALAPVYIWLYYFKRRKRETAVSAQ